MINRYDKETIRVLRQQKAYLTFGLIILCLLIFVGAIACGSGPALSDSSAGPCDGVQSDLGERYLYECQNIANDAQIVCEAECGGGSECIDYCDTQAALDFNTCFSCENFLEWSKDK